MTRKEASPARQDVLTAFAGENAHDGATLARYLVDFPQFAGELVDLSIELRRPVRPDAPSLDAADRVLIDKAWSIHARAAPSGHADPFAGMTADDHERYARILDVPAQLLAAFHERKVRYETIPGRFIDRLAAALRVSSDSLSFALAMPSAPLASWEFDAEHKGHADGRRSFEELLTQAGVSDEQRKDLLRP